MANIKNAVEYKGGVNGLKTILGAALVVAAGQINVIKDLMPLFPDSHVLQLGADYLSQAMFYIQKALQYSGSGLMVFGFIDKIKKLFVH